MWKITITGELNSNGHFAIIMGFSFISVCPRTPCHFPISLFHSSTLSDNHSDTQGLPIPPPTPPHCTPWPHQSMGVNQSLALMPIGNKYLHARGTIMTGLWRKWIPVLIPCIALLFSQPTGSCHGKQLSLDAS